MQEQHRRAGALVQVGEPETERLAVAGPEREAGQALEPLLGRADRGGRHRGCSAMGTSSA